MNIVDLKDSTDPREVGQEIYTLIAELYPICRSITGNGFRQTMETLRHHIPIQIHEIPSGTKVFDWTVPKEWNIRDAYVKTSTGEKVIDFQISNLHVLNYSLPIKKVLSLEELKPHLFTLPDRPDWIPYKTSYYEENWGFCLSHKQFLRLEDGQYEVLIDSTLEDGFLTYGELYLEGEEKAEVLISCHACHPSLCNDNLSGIGLCTWLAVHLGSLRTRYSYRFLFIPGTIGSITWLALNESRLSFIKHGLVVACVGDSGSLTYKKTRRGDAEIDEAVGHVLRDSGRAYQVRDFSPYGYDERQYCSPAFDLPVGSLTRTPYSCYPEYHTSADNLDFIAPDYLANSLMTYLEIIYILEKNRKYLNQSPKCEPQLGKRGLYRTLGGQTNAKVAEMAMLWVLNMSDSRHTLLDIAKRANMRFDQISKAADLLFQHNLLKECLQ